MNRCCQLLVPGHLLPRCPARRSCHSLPVRSFLSPCSCQQGHRAPDRAEPAGSGRLGSCIRPVPSLPVALGDRVGVDLNSHGVHPAKVILLGTPFPETATLAGACGEDHPVHGSSSQPGVDLPLAPSGQCTWPEGSAVITVGRETRLSCCWHSNVTFGRNRDHSFPLRVLFCFVLF